MTSPTDDDQTAWTITWLAGPDTGGSTRLGPGRHLLGRARSAAVRAADPALEPHHALLHVRPDGQLTVTQLSGRMPLRVNGHDLDSPAALAEGDHLDTGTSMLVLHRGPASEPPAALHGRAVVRSPRALPQWQPLAPPAPEPPATHEHGAGALTPALLGLAGAGTMAAVLHQPMFLWFGAMGAFVGIASWGVQHVAAARRRRTDAASHRAACDAHAAAVAADLAAFERWHRAITPTPAGAIAAAAGPGAGLWQRRASHPDAWRVSLGIGDVQLPAPTGDAEPHSLHQLPVAADLGPGDRLAIHGPTATAMSVARSVLLQLATSCGPADLRIVVVTPHPDRWAWLHGLPHAALPDGTTAVLDDDALALALEELSAAGDAHVVLVADHLPTLGTRTSGVRRALADGRRALVAVLPPEAGVPQLCTSALTVSHGRAGRWAPDTARTLLPVPVWPAGIGADTAQSCVTALAALDDPDDPVAASTRTPNTIALADLLAAEGPLTAAGIAGRWRAAGADAAPRTPLGIAVDGTVDLDLVRDGPHGLVAGTTGAGKSELLRSLVAGMAATSPPDRLSFVLVDYKGGASFDACAALPHVVGVVTDLDDQLADRALRSLHAELRRRERLLREHGAADLSALRRSHPQVTLPRLVVVIDEFAALVAEQPRFLHALVGVAQRGRSLGVHLLLATQRPHGVISDDIRANTNLRIALRLHDADDALDVVGDRSPVALPRHVPGRAVMRLGADEHVTFQCARCTSDDTLPLAALVRAIDEAAQLAGIERPPSPWLPPLPTVLQRADVPGDALGMVDLPDEQCTRPMRWHPDDGWTLVAGSSGSGVSATLHTLAVHALRDTQTVVAVLDAQGDTRFDDLAVHPRAVVVRGSEHERLARLLHRLASHATLVPDMRTVLLVDGIDVVRRALDQVDTAAEAEAFERLLMAGPGGGVVVVAGTHRPAAVPASFAGHAAQRWVLHLHDAADATTLGATAAQVPPAVPGRVLLAHDGLVAQLVQPTPAPAPVGSTMRRRVVAIDAVPPVVDAGLLPRGHRVDAATVLSLGIDCRDESAAMLEVPDGDHVMVLGPGRSGRSSVLARLAVAWCQAHPDGRLTAVLPRRSSFPRGLADHVHDGRDDPAEWLDRLRERGSGRAGQHRLLVVDDAELVDHPTLGDLLARPSGLMVLAAGRPDALRQSYGHWTGVVRRSRLGVVAVRGGGHAHDDGDLLGAVLPRQSLVPARPGLVWSIAHGEVTLVQVAVDQVCVVPPALAH